MDIFYDPLKKSGAGFTDLFSSYRGKKRQERKKINLYKDRDELSADVTKFGSLFATLHIKDDVILFTSESGKDVSAYDIKVHYQQNMYNATKPNNVVYYEKHIDSDGFEYANYVQIIGHTAGWDVEMLMVHVHICDEHTQYMILVF